MTKRARRALPDNIVKRMRPEDKQAVGVETFEDADARGDAKRESDLQKACESLLSRLGIEYLHLSCRAREKAGWPDLTFAVPVAYCQHGVPVAVELKTATGKLAKVQADCLSRMQVNGWEVHVCRSYEAFRVIVTRQRHAVNLIAEVQA